MSRKKKKHKLHKPPPLSPCYPEWLEFYFGRLSDKDDPWQNEWEFDVPHEELPGLFAHMLENAAQQLAPFSNRQIAMGLEALFMPDHSDISFLVSDKAICDQPKDRLARALKPFYTDFLANRCAHGLGHLDENSDHPLGYFLYMLWDVSALGDRLIDLQTGHNGNSILVETFGEILLHTPANPACLESILHGLGHMVLIHPKHARQINRVIDSLLIKHPGLRPELIEYAQLAKTGCIQ